MRSRAKAALLSAHLGLLLCGGLVADGSDGDAARQQWMLGYLKAEQAATAGREQHLALSRQLYGEALALFQDVGRRYPGWNPDLVSYRTADCLEQLRRLEETAAATLESMGRPELTAEVRRLREARQGLDARAQGLAMRVEQLESSLQTAVDERLRLSAEVSRLSTETTESHRREADLQARLAALTIDLKAREADLARLQAAASDAAALKTSLADLGRQAGLASQAQQEAAAARAQVADLEVQRRQDAARLQDLLTEADRRRREGEALRAERDSLLRSNRDWKEKAAQAEQTQRAAAAELATVRDQLGDVRRQLQPLSEQRAATATQAQAAAQTIATLEAQTAALREELRGLQAADVAGLRQAHTAALTRISDLEAARARDLAALSAAHDAEQRLTAATEQSRRAAQDTAQAEARRRAELLRLETAAAKALAGGDSAAAETALRELLDASPQNALAAARLGILLAERGDLPAAAPLLQNARRNLPEDIDVLVRLGAVLLRQGQAKPAAAALLQAAVLAPERASTHHLLGAALVEVGWRGAAEQEFSLAFSLDSKRADTAYCLAALLAATDPPRRAEARLWYDRALALGAARDAGLDGFLDNRK